MTSSVRFLTAVVAGIALFGFTTAAFGQSGQKLIASDGGQDDFFGWSVSTNGEFAFIGAWGDDDGGDAAGAVYVFRNTGGNWIESQKLVASNATAGDHFGISVSIDGDYAVIGSPNTDDNSKAGAAYVYKNSGGVWTEMQKLIASDGADNDAFGASVSISGGVAVVGSEGDTNEGRKAGSVVFFQNEADVWNQIQKLPNSSATTNTHFGGRVAISDDRVIIGLQGDYEFGDTTGSVRFFRRVDGDWSSGQTRLASDASSGDSFGAAVAIDGHEAIVGSWGDDDQGDRSGAAYVFTIIETAWSEVKKLTPSDGSTDGGFGYAVSLSGDTAIIGASGSDDESTTTGYTYIYRQSGGDWIEERKLEATDRDTDDGFGRAVSIKGNTVLIGAPYDDSLSSNHGSAYVYNISLLLANDSELKFPSRTILQEIYPNPTTSFSTVSYSLPQSSPITLELYNILGELVRVVEQGFRAAGEHEVQVDAADLSAGIYFLRMTAGDFSQTRKMVVVRRGV